MKEIFEFLALGGVIMVPIALGSVIALTIFLERIWSLQESRVLPDGILEKVIDHIKAAADMGDVMQIKSIAEKLKSDDEILTPICDNVIQLSEDFDLDGISNLVDELNRQVDGM